LLWSNAISVMLEGKRFPQIGDSTLLIMQLFSVRRLHFDMFRKKRNISDYLRAGQVSDQEVIEMIALAKKLRKQVAECIKAQ